VINLRVAEVLAYEIHGTAWEAACLKKGLDPSEATADDVLGRMRDDMWDAAGKRVLTFGDDHIFDDLEAEPVVAIDDPREFMSEVTEVAGLTKQERRVVSAIVDGSPIPDGKQYAVVLSRRLGMGTALVWKHWSNAKKKLRDNWAAQ
jgi:hypothetical protein